MTFYVFFLLHLKENYLKPFMKTQICILVGWLSKDHVICLRPQSVFHRSQSIIYNKTPEFRANECARRV